MRIKERDFCAMTIGDEEGIGPYISLKAWRNLRHTQNHFILYANINQIKSIASSMDIEPPVLCNDKDNINEIFPHALPVFHIKKCNSLQIRSIEVAYESVYCKNSIALVTNPITKKKIADYIPFTGHTDFLQSISSSSHKTYMLAYSSAMKIAFTTLHLPIVSVPKNVFLNLHDLIQQVNIFFKQHFFNINPLIAVSGLNPHSGEGGMLGQEEINYIEPIIRQCQKDKIMVQGPYAADTLFIQNQRKKYDCIICQYHDQGLPFFKSLYFNTGVNCTIGLPFIRTSPIHGSALDKKDKHNASSTSLEEAIKLAHYLHEKRIHQPLSSI